MLIAFWLIFALSLIGILALVLSKLPAASQRPVGRIKTLNSADDTLSYFWRKTKIGLSKIWHFILEAKDLKPPMPHLPLNLNVKNVKKVFRIRVRENEADPEFLPEVSQVMEQEAPVAAKKSAEQLYLETIKRDPLNRDAYEGLGRLYMQEKNYSEAVEVFRFLTKLDASKDIYWSNLGLSLYSIKDYKAAANAYDQAIKLNGKVPVRWVNLGLCFDALDETAKAIKAITQAWQLDKRNIGYMSLLADLYLKVQNKVRAEEVFEQILQLDPSNKPAREKLMKLRI